MLFCSSEAIDGLVIPAGALGKGCTARLKSGAVAVY
jgi:hypothetical protein